MHSSVVVVPQPTLSAQRLTSETELSSSKSHLRVTPTAKRMQL